MILRVPGAIPLWLAGCATGVTRWFEMLAFSLWVLAETGSPLAVALAAVARLVPLLLLSAVLAGWLEGRERGRIVIVSLGAITTVALLMLAMSLLDAVSLPLIYLAAFLGGVSWAVDQPVRRTMLVELVGLQNASAAMGLETAANQLTRMLGAIAGGATVQLVGLTGVFVITSILLGAALLLVASVRPAPRSDGEAPPHRRSRSDLLLGFRVVRDDPLLLGTALLTIIFNVFVFPYTALAPVIAERSLGLPPFEIGLLMGCEGFSGFLASILMTLAARPSHFRRIYTLGPLLVMATNIPFALTGSPALAAVLQLVAGLGMAGFAAMQTVIPLMVARPEVRLRVLGVITTCIGTSPLGFLHAGLMGELLGPGPALLLLTLEGLLAQALVLWWIPGMLGNGVPEPRDRAP